MALGGTFSSLMAFSSTIRFQPSCSRANFRYSGTARFRAKYSSLSASLVTQKRFRSSRKSYMAALLEDQHTVRHGQRPVRTGDAALPAAAVQPVGLSVLRMAPLLRIEVRGSHPAEQHRTHGGRDRVAHKGKIQLSVADIVQDLLFQRLFFRQELLPLTGLFLAFIRKTLALHARFIGAQPRLDGICQRRFFVGASIDAVRLLVGVDGIVPGLLCAEGHSGEPVRFRQRGAGCEERQEMMQPGFVAHAYIFQLHQQGRVLYHIADDFVGHVQHLS